MADPIYPLFLREEGNYFTLVKSPEHLNYKLEENDVEEFTGWDSTGRPVALYFEDKRLGARIISETDESEKMKQAVMQFVHVYVNDTDRYPEAMEGDLVKLLEWVEQKQIESWKANRIRVRLKKFVLRLLGKLKSEEEDK